MENGQEDLFFELKPKLDPVNEKIFYTFYDLRREVEPGKRIKAVDIKEAISSLPIEEDYGLLILQAVDDFYLELYANRLKALQKTGGKSG